MCCVSTGQNTKVRIPSSWCKAKLKWKINSFFFTVAVIWYGSELNALQIKIIGLCILLIMQKIRHLNIYNTFFSIELIYRCAQIILQWGVHEQQHPCMWYSLHVASQLPLPLHKTDSLFFSEWIPWCAFTWD